MPDPPEYTLPVLTVRPDNRPQQLILSNMGKPMVKRMFDPNAPSKHFPGYKGESTHLMSMGSVGEDPDNPSGYVASPKVIQDKETGDLRFAKSWRETARVNDIYMPVKEGYTEEFAEEFSEKGYKRAVNDLQPWFGGKGFPEPDKFKYGGMVKAKNGFPYPPPGMMPLTGSMFPMMTANDQSDAYKAYQYQQANPFVVQRSTPGDPNDVQYQQFKPQKTAGQLKDDQEVVLESYSNALGSADDSGLDIKFTPGQSYPFSGGLAYDKKAVAGINDAMTKAKKLGVPPPPDGSMPYNPQDDLAIQGIHQAMMDTEIMPGEDGTTTPITTPGETIPDELMDPATGGPISEEAAKRKGIDSAAYFGLIKGMDFASLIKNVMQPPPPNVQLAQTHLQRVDLDNTPFDTERAKIGEMQNKSFRNFREGAGQIGDLMRGVSAISGQGQEALRNVSVAERQQQNQESMMNVEIQNKEQMIQDQQHDKELMTNYQIQQQAQQVKNKMITDSLTNIKKDFQVEAQYNEQKEAMARQEEYDRDYIGKQQEVQLLTLAHQQAIGFDETAEYKKGLRTERLNFLETTKEDMKKDYGDRFDFDAVDAERTKVSETAENIRKSEEYFKDAANIPVHPGAGADQAALDAYTKSQTQYDKDVTYLKALQDQQALDEAELGRKDKYMSEFDRRFRESDIESTYRESYTKAKGLMTPQQIQRRIEKLLTAER